MGDSAFQLFLPGLLSCKDYSTCQLKMRKYSICTQPSVANQTTHGERCQYSSLPMPSLWVYPGLLTRCTWGIKTTLNIIIWRIVYFQPRLKLWTLLAGCVACRAKIIPQNILCGVVTWQPLIFVFQAPGPLIFPFNMYAWGPCFISYLIYVQPHTRTWMSHAWCCLKVIDTYWRSIEIDSY